MVKREVVLFSIMDLTDSINLLKYVNEFKKNFEIVYVTFSNSSILSRKAAELDIHPICLPPLLGYKKTGNKESIFEKMQAIERQIGIPIQKIIFGDREFHREYKKNELSSLSWLVHIWNKYEQLIEENDVNIHFCFGEDRLQSLIPYYILKNTNGKSYLVRIVPYYGITFTNDYFGKFTFEGNCQCDKVNFEDYKARIKENKVYFNSEVLNKVDYKRYASLPRLLRRIFEIEKINWEDRKNIYKNHNIHLINTFITKPMTHGIKRMFAKIMVYGQIKEDQRYIYFPFHFTDDAQVRLKYPEGYNQYELIRNISRNLPIGFKLLVKEHPAYSGNYSLMELHDLAKFPNITVINPEISSKDIFSYSEYVITINSTVGYEALFYDKIVITMGESFYDSFPGVINIKDVNELYGLLTDEEFLKGKKDEIKENLGERTIRLLKSSLRYDYYNFYSDENIMKMKNLLLHHIKYQENNAFPGKPLQLH